MWKNSSSFGWRVGVPHKFGGNHCLLRNFARAVRVRISAACIIPCASVCMHTPPTIPIPPPNPIMPQGALSRHWKSFPDITDLPRRARTSWSASTTTPAWGGKWPDRTAQRDTRGHVSANEACVCLLSYRHHRWIGGRDTVELTLYYW